MHFQAKLDEYQREVSILDLVTEKEKVFGGGDDSCCVKTITARLVRIFDWTLKIMTFMILT